MVNESTKENNEDNIKSFSDHFEEVKAENKEKLDPKKEVNAEFELLGNQGEINQKKNSSSEQSETDAETQARDNLANIKAQWKEAVHAAYEARKQMPPELQKLIKSMNNAHKKLESCTDEEERKNLKAAILIYQGQLESQLSDEETKGKFEVYLQHMDKARNLGTEYAQLKGSMTPPPGNRSGIGSDPLADYVNLLRAKEKWRNREAVFVPKKVKKFLLGWSVKNDQQYLQNEEEIRTNFRHYAAAQLAGTDDKAGSMEAIYADLQKRMSSSPRMTLAHFTRKGWVKAARIALAVGFGAAAFLTGGVLAAVAGVGVLATGAIGRFLAVDAAWDTVHGAVSTREKKGTYGMAGTVFHNKQKKLHKSAKKVLAGDISVEAVDNDFMKYAGTLAKQRFWKRAVGVLAAAALPVLKGLGVLKWFGIGGGEDAVQKPGITEPGTTQPVKPPVTAATDHYVVPNGGGYWHIAEKILHDRLGGNFDSLPKGERNDMINFLHRYLIDNHERLGISPDEMHPHVGKGAPWLNRGADLFFKDADAQDAFTKFLRGGKKIPSSLLSGNTASNVVSSMPKMKLAA